MSRRPKAATNAFTPSGAVEGRRSTPLQWTIRRAMACVSGQLRSARSFHRSDKAGGGLHCIGWMRLLQCLRPRKGGRADQRLLYEAAVSPDPLPPTRYSATDLDEDLLWEGQASALEEAHGINCNGYALYAGERGGMADPARPCRVLPSRRPVPMVRFSRRWRAGSGVLAPELEPRRLPPAPPTFSPPPPPLPPPPH